MQVEAEIQSADDSDLHHDELLKIVVEPETEY
jgi:hypothetical protein